MQKVDMLIQDPIMIACRIESNYDSNSSGIERHYHYTFVKYYSYLFSLSLEHFCHLYSSFRDSPLTDESASALCKFILQNKTVEDLW